MAIRKTRKISLRRTHNYNQAELGFLLFNLMIYDYTPVLYVCSLQRLSVRSKNTGPSKLSKNKTIQDEF